MIRSYSQSDICKWADYSGDRNRVHFDREFALKNGFKGIIIQGMLALMDAKIALAPLMENGCWLHFYIKRPVAVGSQIQFTAQRSGNQPSVTVFSEEPGKPCIIGTALAAPPPTIPQGVETISAPSGMINSGLVQLERDYPNIENSWLKMDTLLFALSFREQKGDYFHRQSQKISSHYSQERIATFHVAQKLYISNALFEAAALDFSDISFIIEEEDIFTLSDSAYNIFRISAVRDKEIIYQSAIECMTKAFS